MSASNLFADIDGFSNLHESIWTQNIEPKGPPLVVGDDFVQITSGDPGQYRSIWFNSPQNITQFMATFKYRLEDNDIIQGTKGGVLFVVQNDPEGLKALSLSSFGYGDGMFVDGIQPSVAITVESSVLILGDETLSGAYVDGDFTDDSPSIAPTTAFMFTDMLVTIHYDGSSFSVTIDDSINPPFQTSFSYPDLEVALGSPNALVGFTAGSEGSFDFGAAQVISDFQFVELGDSPLLGDVNLDGSVDLLDVIPFVELLAGGGFQVEADINQDGVVNLLDVEPFVDLLAGG